MACDIQWYWQRKRLPSLPLILTIQRIMLQETFLIGVQLVLFNDVVMRSKQNPAPGTNTRNALKQSGCRSWKNSTLVESGYYCSSDKTYYFIKNLTILTFTDTSSWYYSPIFWSLCDIEMLIILQKGSNLKWTQLRNKMATDNIVSTREQQTAPLKDTPGQALQKWKKGLKVENQT